MTTKETLEQISKIMNEFFGDNDERHMAFANVILPDEIKVITVDAEE